MIKEAIENAPKVVEQALSKGPYVAAGGGIFSTLTASEIGIYGSLLLGFLTLIGNMYFKRVQTKIMNEALTKSIRRDDIPEALVKINEHID